jgi:hypothetical protein
MEKDFCKLRLGPYTMHFTGYQPEVTGASEFCEDIPRTGHTVIALDAIDEVLRDMPLEVRIIRDTGDESKLDEISVVHLPPKRYPSGTVSFDYRFEQAGKFVGLVTTGEHGEHQSRFPFSVAAGRSSKEPWFWGLAIIAGGALLFLFSERRHAAGKRA